MAVNFKFGILTFAIPIPRRELHLPGMRIDGFHPGMSLN